METMIDLIDVTKSYGKGLPAVNHANLHVDKGEFVFVVGSSGSGKSTLIKLLMKELDSTSGQMIVSGERLEKMKHRRVAKYRRKLGVVFQKAASALMSSASVIPQDALGTEKPLAQKKPRKKMKLR